MAIYFIYDKQTNAIKIGKSRSLKKRLNALQCSCPSPLKLISFKRTTDAGEDAKLEKQLHERFRDYKINGEWFLLEGGLQDYLNGIAPLDNSIRCEGFIEQLKENYWKIWIRFYKYDGRFCKNYYSKKLWDVTEQEAKDVLKEKLKLFESQESRETYIKSNNTHQTLIELYNKLDIDGGQNG